MNTAHIRALVVAAASVLCITISRPAGATLPGDGYYNLNYAASPAGEIVSVNTGVTSEMTCFLSRVAGNLTGPASAQAVVSLQDGNWWVSYGNSYEGSVEVSIACVWGNTNILYAGFNGTGTEVIAGTDSSSQCFLQGIYTTDDDSFSATDAEADVSKTGSGGWELQTYNLAWDPSEDAGTYTKAICVDVPGVSWFEENNWTGDYTVTAFEQTTSDPEVCGLRGIAGEFEGTGDSVGVYGPSALPGYWELETTGGEVDRGWITCLQ